MNIAMKIARETELCVFIKMCVTACVCVCACKSLYFAYECVNGSVSKWVKVSECFVCKSVCKCMGGQSATENIFFILLLI